MTEADSTPSTPSQNQLSDSLLSLHILLIWLLTLVFCWKVFPSIFTTTTTTTASSLSNSSSDLSSVKSTPDSVPKSERQRGNECLPFKTALPPPVSPPAKSKQSIASPNKKLLSQLQLEACSKAKEAGEHPSYVTLVLNLVHHYNLDINQPVMDDGFSIFHCSCLSGSLELVSSLSPMADIHLPTDQGDSPLYLAVYSAGQKGGQDVEGIDVVQHLLQAGSQVNQKNLAGLTALHQASRLSSPELVRLLLDWGADQKVSVLDRTGASIRKRNMSDWGADQKAGVLDRTGTGANIRKKNMSVITRQDSVITRSMTSKVDGLNRSFMVNKDTTRMKK